MKKNPKEPNNTTPIPNVLLPLQATDEPSLLKRLQLAQAIGVSSRSIDNWTKRKLIPYIKISARCVRFSLPAVLRALSKFEVREAGRR
jgi:hypothetical protein